MEPLPETRLTSACASEHQPGLPIPAAGLEIRISRGDEINNLLKSSAFLDGWQALQKTCPWATPFQSPEFVSTWYDVYQPPYEPILVQGYSAAGELVGLLSLACSGGSRELVVAGSPQSEYQVWLAAPAWSEAFPRQALAQLRLASNWNSLTFAFLPANTPLDWMRGDPDLFSCCRMEAANRPLIELGNPELKKKLWKSRTTKSHLNRLQRLGKMCLEHVSDLERFESVLDEIASYYDLRIGALSGLLPFANDSRKKRFLLKLMEKPNLLHVTLLRFGGTFAAANIGFCQQGTVGLDLLSYSPFQARHSPGKIHVLLLAERLAEEGFTTLDLTPDGGWKERLATSQDTVHKLTIYLRSSANWRNRFVAGVKGAAKRLLHKIGVNPQWASGVYHRANSLKVRHLPEALGRGAANLFRSQGLWIYCVKPEMLLGPSEERHTAVDRLDHLLAGVEGAGRPEAKNYLSSALKRLEAGCRVHTSIRDGNLEWSCWSFAGNGQTAVPELVPVFVPPAQSAVLFGFHTTADSEVCRRCMQEIHEIAAGAGDISDIYLLIDAADRKTRDVAERFGGVCTGFLSKAKSRVPVAPKEAEPLAE